MDMKMVDSSLEFPVRFADGVHRIPWPHRVAWEEYENICGSPGQSAYAFQVYLSTFEVLPVIATRPIRDQWEIENRLAAEKLEAERLEAEEKAKKERQRKAVEDELRRISRMRDTQMYLEGKNRAKELKKGLKNRLIGEMERIEIGIAEMKGKLSPTYSGYAREDYPPWPAYCELSIEKIKENARWFLDHGFSCVDTHHRTGLSIEYLTKLKGEGVHDV
jgi:hypothetical protein